MTIKIHKLAVIQAYQIEEIIQYYNTYKPDASEPLQQCEGGGGFMIAVKGSNQKIMHKNQCIKQLKWHKNILVTYIDYVGFSEEEERLLYIAMINVLGDENVKQFNAYSEAYMSSPSFLEMMMNNCVK
jgi:hypothetical protein